MVNIAAHGQSGLDVSDEMKRLASRITFQKVQREGAEEPALMSDLFDGLARSIASELGKNPKDESNKPAQIRRFYDELVGWESRIGDSKPKFEANEAFFRMLNAKVAYAFGRGRDEKRQKPGLVDDNFRHWFTKCMNETIAAQPETLKYFRLHFEAVLGFLRALRP